MPSRISISFSIPSYLKQFLIYESDHKEYKKSGILVFPKRHQYNLLLRNILTNRRDCFNSFENKYDSVVKIKLPFNSYKDVYFYNMVSVKNRAYFIKEIRLDFEYAYVKYIRDAVLYKKMQRKLATEMFLDKYGIDEDMLKYGSMYRKYTRYQKRERLTL